MKHSPTKIVCDTLVSEAKRLLAENNLHVLPVMDGKQLRGLVTRSDCLRAAYFVSKTQSPDEFAYFTERLKVKDIMVRNPATIAAEDSMEYCLEKGSELGVAQFPVTDKGEIVGIISANEIFAMAAEFLGAWGACKGLTLAPVVMKSGTIKEITDIVTSVGADLQAVYPVGSTELPEFRADKERKVIVRFCGKDQSEVAQALAQAGYPVLD